MSQRKRLLLIAGGIPLGVLLFVVAAWGIDTAVTGDRVVRNVSVGEQSVGGLDQADLEAVGVELTSDLSNRPVELVVGDETIATDAFALGVRVDGPTLAQEALDARRGGFFLLRPFKWVGTFFSDEQLEVPYVIDEGATDQSVAQLVSTALDDPVEPYMTLENDELVVVPGADGATLDPQLVIDALPAMLAAGEPYSLALESDPLHPELDTAELDAVAAEANTATANDVTIRVLRSTTDVSSSQLRSWVELDLSGDTPTWKIDQPTALDELRTMLPRLGSEDQLAHFDIVDGKPIIVPPSESVVCCADDTPETLKAALLAGGNVDPVDEGDGEDPDDETDDESETPTAPTVLIELEAKTAGADEGIADLEALGIIEEISTFTTKHDCCQGRVTNIHNMADIVRGAVIPPGESFSLNGFVGKRTTERGFVPAHAIADGILEDQVGGGVSQFATTTFNAAFFAGIEIPEYQSHSLYFSRYPRGREATISWPKPDLVLRNQTPYGILIWTSYTDTSLTVTMYSTKHIAVEDIGRNETAQGACTRVTTTRQRTYDDGTVDLDTFFGLYRPGEGIDCNGNSTVPTTEPPPVEEEPETTDTTDPNAPPTTAPPVTEPPAETTTTSTP
ncbi:MAG: VanW family protein [Acidimicrobiales bacterium]